MLCVVPHQKFHYTPEKKLQWRATFWWQIAAYLDITLVYKHSLLHVNNIYEKYQENRRASYSRGNSQQCARVVSKSSLSFVNYLDL